MMCTTHTHITTICPPPPIDKYHMCKPPHTQVTERGVEQLARNMTWLTSLELFGTKVTDNSCLHLRYVHIVDSLFLSIAFALFCNVVLHLRCNVMLCCIVVSVCVGSL